jgi:hypothetical protein
MARWLTPSGHEMLYLVLLYGSGRGLDGRRFRL